MLVLLGALAWMSASVGMVAKLLLVWHAEHAADDA